MHEPESTPPASGIPRRHEPTRSVRAVFSDVSDGLAAMDEFRAAGFVIDASADGDVIVTVQATSDRFDELEAIVEAYGGRTAR